MTALSPAVFDLDLDAVVASIERFVQDKMRELSRVGVVVPLSGGLDSSTVTALCARAVGRERVTALVLRDRKVLPETIRYAHAAADRLGVTVVERDLTSLQRAAGVYGYAGYRVPGWLAAALARASRARPGYDVLIARQRGEDRRTREAFVAVNMRQRLRMTATYRYAEAHRLLVAGAAQRTEELLGLFVKFGVDHAADVMPLKALYRTQVVAVARKVGVPDQIIVRPPSAEMLPGDRDKYLDVLKTPASSVDLVLWGIEHGMTDGDITRAASVTVAKVAEIREIVRLSAHMREPSQSLGSP